MNESAKKKSRVEQEIIFMIFHEHENVFLSQSKVFLVIKPSTKWKIDTMSQEFQLRCHKL